MEEGTLETKVYTFELERPGTYRLQITRRSCAPQKDLLRLHLSLNDVDLGASIFTGSSNFKFFAPHAGLLTARMSLSCATSYLQQSHVLLSSFVVEPPCPLKKFEVFRGFQYD